MVKYRRMEDGNQAISAPPAPPPDGSWMMRFLDGSWMVPGWFQDGTQDGSRMVPGWFQDAPP